MHIAFIMDGNRRYARGRGLNAWKGHEQGKENLDRVLNWAGEKDIEQLTFYVFSVQNFDRDKAEVEKLFSLFRRFYKEIEHDQRIHEQQIRIRFLGDLCLFPADIKESAEQLMEKTKGNTKRTLNFAFGYGGREEIVRATRQIAQKIKQGALDVDAISEQEFAKHLYMSDQPDLIIRTGGEVRTSNFLSWQSAYSEWIFLDKHWPEITEQDLDDCLSEFSSRQRRYGG